MPITSSSASLSQLRAAQVTNSYADKGANLKRKRWNSTAEVHDCGGELITLFIKQAKFEMEMSMSRLL